MKIVIRKTPPSYLHIAKHYPYEIFAATKKLIPQIEIATKGIVFIPKLPYNPKRGGYSLCYAERKTAIEDLKKLKQKIEEQQTNNQ